MLSKYIDLNTSQVSSMKNRHAFTATKLLMHQHVPVSPPESVTVAVRLSVCPLENVVNPVFI